MSPFFFILMQFAILAYGLVGGVFLAFSDFIMRSLSLTGGVGGVEAMQVINREVFRWVFMALFLGMAALSLVVAGYGAVNLTHPSGALILLAGLAYLIGCFGVTVFFNVPMNEALDSMDLTSEATRAYWTGTYLPRWTFWNSVRTLACCAAAALLLVGLLWSTQSQLRVAQAQAHLQRPAQEAAGSGLRTRPGKGDDEMGQASASVSAQKGGLQPQIGPGVSPSEIAWGRRVRVQSALGAAADPASSPPSTVSSVPVM